MNSFGVCSTLETDIVPEFCAFEQYPQLRVATGALTGIGFGLAIGSRIMGGFGVLYGLGALALLFAVETRADGLRSAGARLGRFVPLLLLLLLLAYAVMALVWPWSVADPLNPLRALAYFSRFFEQPWSELFGGESILVTDMPRRYVKKIPGAPPGLVRYTNERTVRVASRPSALGAPT